MTSPRALVPQTARSGGLMIVTTDSIPGYQIVQTLGLVRGNTVRTRNVGVDILAGLRNLVGGEVELVAVVDADVRVDIP